MDSDAPTRTKLARIIKVATITTIFLIRFSFRSSVLLLVSGSGRCLVDRKWRGRPEAESVSESTRTAAGRTTLVVVALTVLKVTDVDLRSFKVSFVFHSPTCNSRHDTGCVSGEQKIIYVRSKSFKVKSLLY